MSSARALLREAASSRLGAGGADGPTGFSDPYAVHATKGKPLRCRACNYQTIKHDSLWAPHVASKSHRANVARIKAEEEAAARKQALLEEAEEERRRSIAEAEAIVDGKRKRVEEEADGQQRAGSDSKRLKADETAGAEDDELETDWAQFQREVLNAPSTSTNATVHPLYESATIFAEPVLVNEDGQLEVQGDGSAEAAPALKETAEERRLRLEREEKEEIYARFEEEQRVQDEAEERVAALKARLARIKEERQAKASGKKESHKIKGKETGVAGA